MPLPKPEPGEDENAFMERCIPVVDQEVDSNEQALAICATLFDEQGKSKSHVGERKNMMAPLELTKSLDEGGGFEGYASVFGVQDSDGDVIVKGAFRKSIDQMQKTGRMPKMLWQHNPTMIVGKFTEMTEDDHGLFVKGRLIMEVEKGREAYALMKEGVLDAMSVGFNIGSAMPGDSKARGVVIDEADLWEISLVTWGANPEALISNVKHVKTIKDFERLLREAGFSRNEAAGLASKGYKAVFGQSESDPDNELIDELKSLTQMFKEATHG